MIQRLLNIISSNSLLVVIYLVNRGVDINRILNKIGINKILNKLGISCRIEIPIYCSYCLYLLIVIAFAFFVKCLFSRLRSGEIPKDSIEELDVDNSGLLAIILAYVFVGLSITSNSILVVIIGFLLVFNLCGTSYIYNPLFYVFGYHYYFVRSAKVKILVMTKTKYPLGTEIDFPNCKCLNDYTYIDMSK